MSSWLKAFVLLLLQQVTATFYFTLTDSYVNTETAVYVYYKPSSATAYTESYMIITIPSRLGFSYAEATPTTCVDAGFIAGSFTSAPVCEFSENGDDLELKISGLASTASISKYEISLSGLITSKAEVQNWVDNDSGTGVYVTTYDSSDTVLETQTTQNNFQVQYSTLTSGVSLSGEPSQNNRAGKLTVLFKMVNPLPESGTFTFALPYQNSQYDGLIVAPHKSMIVDEDSLVLKVTSTNPAAAFTKAIFSVEEESDFVILKIQMNNAAEIASGATLKIELSDMLMPPSKAPLSGFKMWTGDSAYSKIDFANYPTLTNALPGNQNTVSMPSSVSMLGKTGVGEADQKYRFTVYLSGDLPMDSYFTLQIPASVGLPSNPALSLGFVCLAGCDEEEMTVTYEEPSRLLKFDGVVPDENSAVYAPGPISFELDGFTNPSSSDDAEFIFTTYASFDKGEFMIDQISGMIINAEQGAIVISQFEPTDGNYMIYGVAESWTVTMACEHALEVSASPVIRLTLPSDFYVINTNACVVTELNPSFRCTTNNKTSTIVISNFLKRDIGKFQKFTFTVDSIRNPTQIKQEYGVTIQILSDSGGVVDVGTVFVWDYLMTIGIVKSFTVTPEDYTVGAAPTFYKFTVQPSGELQEKSYLEITLPEEVELYRESELELKCSYGLSGFTYNRISCAVFGGNRIRISGGFAFEPTTNMIENNEAMVPPTLEFRLPQFRNPRTMKETGAFGVTIFDKAGDEIYTWNKTYAQTVNGKSSSSLALGPAIQMSKSSTPKNIDIAADSTQNGALTNYNISITASTYLSEGDTIILKLPSPFFFSESTVVTGASSNLRKSQKYVVSIDLDEIEVTLQLPLSRRRRLQSGSLQRISPDSIFTLSFSDIKNGVSTEPSSGSLVYSVYSEGYLIESQSTGLTLQNTEPGNIVAALTTIFPTDFQQSLINNYTLTFRPVNYQRGMEIKLYLPVEVEFGQNSIKCYGLQGTDKETLSCTQDTAERSITITDAFQVSTGSPGTIVLVYETLKNPQQNVVTSSFRIETYTATGYQLDHLTKDLTVNFFCEYPCKACADTDPSHCLECYSVGDFLLLHDNECLSGCPTSFTLTPETQSNCTKCDDLCATCDLFPSTCTSCFEGFRLQDGTCYERVIWPFPWILIALFQLTLVVCSEICTRTESRAKETYVALLWFPELGAWASFMFFHSLRRGFLGSFLIAGVALVIYGILNCLHMCVHRRKIKPKSLHSYKAIQTNWRCVSSVVMWTSYCLSFRFSLILVSYFCMFSCFRGDYSNLNWLHHNRISLAFLVLCYPLLMCATGFFLSTDGLYSYAGFAAIEVIVLSSLMAMMTLLDAITGMRRTATHEEPNYKRRKVKPQDGADVMGDYESDDLDSESGKKQKRRRAKDQLEQVVEYGDDSANIDYADRSRASDRPLISLSQFNLEANLDDETKAQVAQLEEMARQMREEKELLRKEKEALLIQRQKRKLKQSQQQMEETHETTQNNISQQLIVRENFENNVISVPEARSPPRYRRQYDQIQSESEAEPLDETVQVNGQGYIQSGQTVLKRPYRDIEGLEMEQYKSPVQANKSFKQLPDYEQCEESDDAPEEGVLVCAQLPIPTFGLVGVGDNHSDPDNKDGGFGSYYRQVDDGPGERALRQISPRQGGDSLIGNDSIYCEGHVRLESQQSPKVMSPAENHPSIEESIDELFASNASGRSVTNAKRLVTSSEVYQLRSDAQMELQSSRDGIKTAEQHIFDQQNADFGPDDPRTPLTANEVNPFRPELITEEVENNTSMHASLKQFFVGEPASRGDTNPPKSSYEIEPEHYINNNAHDAYGTADGPIQRQATPEQYFVDRPASQGRITQESNHKETQEVYLNAKNEAVTFKETRVVNKDGVGEVYGIDVSQGGLAEVVSNAERNLFGSELVNLDRESPQFSRQKSIMTGEQSMNQVLPGTATYSDDMEILQGTGQENYVLPASAQYDKVGIKMIEGPQNNFIGSDAVMSDADPIATRHDAQQDFMAQQQYALFTQGTDHKPVATADLLKIEQKTEPQFSILESQQKSTQHNFIKREQAKYSRMPEETMVKSGPQDMSFDNPAVYSQRSEKEIGGTEQLHMDQLTNPKYQLFESQRRSSQQEYNARNHALFLRPPVTDKQNEEKVIRMGQLELADDSGASESSEGILDHNPFTSIKKNFKIRDEQQDAADLIAQAPHPRFQQQQIMYSDKSESSVEEGMDITPSNYNMQNGRFDGKSQGLKGLALAMSGKSVVSASLPMSPSQFVNGKQQPGQHHNVLRSIDEESLLSDPILNAKSKRKAIKTNKTFAESQEVQMGVNLASHINQAINNSQSQLNPLPKQTNNYI